MTNLFPEPPDFGSTWAEEQMMRQRTGSACLGGSCSLAHYEVIVGNIGRIYEGGSPLLAMADYRAYVGQSKSGTGRVAGEHVTILKDGAVWAEYHGR